MIAGLLRGAADLACGAADFVDAVGQALDEQRTGFSEREAGDYLNASGLADAVTPDDDMEAELTRLSLKLHRIRELADGWLNNGEHRGVPSQLLSILNEGINFWTPESHPVRLDDLVAHITAIRRSVEDRGFGGTAVDEEIATDLLSDYRITKK